MPHRGTNGCRAPAAVLRINTAKSISDCGEDVATAEGRGARSDGLTEERLLDFLRGMIEIRLFEDEIQLLFNRNLVRGSTHLIPVEQQLDLVLEETDLNHPAEEVEQPFFG